MPVCDKHQRYYPADSICPACWKAKKNPFKKQFYSAKPTPLNNLRKRVNSEFSKLIKLKYDKGGYAHCFTCGKLVGMAGIFGAHCGHYFTKSTYWGLAYDERNAGIQCYDCNVNKQGDIPAMRRRLVEIHGAAAVEALELDAETFFAKKKQRLVGTKPDETFLRDSLKVIQNRIKELTT